ncbi:MAG: class I SAM-dependent methyltransferase [Gemmataceae bacterium]|nr:class I SAM-dependent methyltransferase [Gemmataceae bacterium]MDW8264598.1 class I SAM-dependent methyltransferase [Gemmataceae bacterium]
MATTASLSPADLRREMAQYTWYHTVELAPGLVTPGQYDHRPVLPHYGIPEDLSGKTVLDVGPAHGFFAFEFEKRGAARVVTAELPAWSEHDGSPDLKTEFKVQNVDVANLSYLHGALEFAIRARQSRVERRFCNVYDLNPHFIGAFDLVFCGSLLIHLTDPLRALYAIRSVTRERAIICTVIDSPCHCTWWWQARRCHPMNRLCDQAPRAVFFGTRTGQSFWAPNMVCLERWALAAGFNRVERFSTFTLQSTDGQFQPLHGTIHAYV